MAENTDLTWGQQQRFEFLEWRVYWTGRVNRRDLETEFSISTPQASIDLRNYQEAAPKNIDYSSTEKTYLPTQNFRPKFLALSPQRYLLQLHAITTGAIRKEDTWFDELPTADVVPTILRGPEAYTLRAVVRSIENQEALPINYLSLTKRSQRTICPHSLAFDGSRWHVRAWSVEREEFRDFVLARILSVSKPTAVSTANPVDDVEWNTQIKLRLIAHPELSDEEREAVQHDYRLKDGALEIEMRIALAFYFVRRHYLDLRDGQIPPERSQLFLSNYDEYVAATRRAKEESRQRMLERKQSGELHSRST